MNLLEYVQKIVEKGQKVNIEELIDKWYEGDIECHLYEYLSMTIEEYYEFVKLRKIPERFNYVYYFEEK